MRLTFCLCHNFNSIKVRLEPLTEVLRYFRDKFQFHKGTIRTPYSYRVLSVLSYFNSIKVRLELPVHTSLLLTTLVFQFHKGTIRTVCTFPSCCKRANFNSIKVRLERPSLCYPIFLNQISIP